MELTPKTLHLIQRVASHLAPKYKFGYYDIEDIEQEAILMGIESLPLYNESLSSLATFLQRHMNNRLQNFVRNKHYRRRSICPKCGSKDTNPACDSCVRYKWGIEYRKNLLKPLPIDLVEEDDGGIQIVDDFENRVDNAELFSIIDRELPVSFRSDYLKLKEGLHVPYGRRLRLIDKLKEILNG